MNQMNLPQEGAASDAIQRLARDVWLEKAHEARIDLSDFNPDAPLRERLAWAQSQGLEIGVVCARYSHKRSHSTPEQVEESVTFGARHRIYCPPEFVCVDEAVSGRKSFRAGLDRAKFLMQVGRATVLIVYKLSRLLRTCYKSVAFIQEEIVDEGLRAISVTQRVDTRDKENWRKLVYLYGLMDETLLTTIADHVRSGQKQLFAAGYSTGALTLGYDAVPVEGMKTKLGRERTKPKLNDAFKEMLQEHFALHLGGLSITGGWKRWIANGGARDPRSKRNADGSFAGRMSYHSYRYMLSNPRYTGRWAFGKMQNIWESRREIVHQKEQPDDNIVLVHLEELRAIDDPTFLKMQAWLAENAIGPRAPRRPRPKMIWDYVTMCYVCGAEECLHHGAGYNQGMSSPPKMTCKSASFCPNHIILGRDEAFIAIAQALQGPLTADESLVTDIVNATVALDADRGAVEAEIARLESRRTVLSGKIKGLLEMVGVGTEEDQRETRGHLATAQKGRQEVDLELSVARGRLDAHEPLDPERVRARLNEFAALLIEAGTGKLGEDAVHRAVRVFKLLTGGRITVEAVPRPGRKRKAVLGHFQLNIMGALLEDAGYEKQLTAGSKPMSIWLRRVRSDHISEQVHQLVDVEGLNYVEVVDRLRDQGIQMSKGGVEQAYRRYYRMRGLPVPKRPYNNGKPRRSAKVTKAVEYADRVKELADQKIHFKVIGVMLNLKKDQVTLAFQAWHRLRGLPIPDGRTRRKELGLKNPPSA